MPRLVTDLVEAGATPGEFAGRDDLVSFIAPHYATGVTDPADAAQAYLATFASAYGVADPAERFDVVSVTESAAGTIVRFSQTMTGVLVFGGDITVVVSTDGVVQRVTGVVVPDASLPAPVLSEDDAAATALDWLATADDGGGAVVDGPGDLVVFSPAVDNVSPAAPVLAWLVPVLVATDGVALAELVIVSAADGTILLRAAEDATEQAWDLSDTANQLTADGKPDFSNATLVFEMRDGTRTQKSTPDATATAAADNFTTSWDYFATTHSRDSFDGNGGACDIYVHVGVSWRNASSNRNCFVQIGDAQPYAQTLDVLAHEFTHSVTGRTAGLVYEGASGALNEHFSDFFATMVDRSDWLITLTSRDTSNPAIDQASEFWNTTTDKGGVHSNSGIGNKAGFLVADDGLNVHPGSGVEVQGIGRAKAEQLWYATLLSLTPRTGFYPWACATINTARSMPGFSEDDVRSVVDAMLAVELVTEDDGRISCDYLNGSSAGGPGTTPATTDPTDATAPSSSEPSDTGSPTECSLVGTWRLRDQTFFDELARLMGDELSAVGGSIEYVSGDYVIEVNDDGTVWSRRQAWSFRVGSPQGSMVVVISSDDPGVWSATDHTLTIDESASNAVVSLYVEVDGQLTPLPVGTSIPVNTEAMSGAGTYECIDDVLYLTVNTDRGPMTVVSDRVA